MNDTYVYDKAKYHDESVAQLGLPEQHAANHALPILRWLIENNLVSEFFKRESGATLESFQKGDSTIYDLYQWWDCCLIGMMLSKNGNRFSMHYFDFSKGAYIADYKQTLQRNLPSEYCVTFSEENYAAIKTIIDTRYAAWQAHSSPWWKFWR